MIDLVKIVDMAKERLRTAEEFETMKKANLGLVLFAEAIVQQNTEIEALQDELGPVKLELATAHELLEVKEKELADLREKLRWRKHSEEPMPNDDTVILVSNIESAVTVAGSEVYAPNISKRENIYWMPIKLPGASDA